MLRQRPIIIEIYRRFNRTLNIMASSFVPIFYMVQDHLRSAFFKCKPTIFLHKYDILASNFVGQRPGSTDTRVHTEKHQFIQ